MKDHPVNMAIKLWSRQVVFGDWFNYIEMCDLLPGICGPSRQVVSHGSGLARQISLCILNGACAFNRINVVLFHSTFRLLYLRVQWSLQFKTPLIKNSLCPSVIQLFFFSIQTSVNFMNTCKLRLYFSGCIGSQGILYQPCKMNTNILTVNEWVDGSIFATVASNKKST